MTKKKLASILKKAHKTHAPIVLFHRAVTGERGSNYKQQIQLILNRPEVNGIELDVQKTRDGVIVVRHDFALKTRNGVEWIKAISFKELREVLGKKECPTFNEFIQALGNTQKIVDIEIKQPGIAKELVRKYKSKEIYKQFIFTTMYEDVYQEIEQADNQVAWMWGYPRDKGKNLALRWWAQPIVRLVLWWMKVNLEQKLAIITREVPCDFISLYHKIVKPKTANILRADKKYLVIAVFSTTKLVKLEKAKREIQKAVASGAGIIKTDYPEFLPLLTKVKKAKLNHGGIGSFRKDWALHRKRNKCNHNQKRGRERARRYTSGFGFGVSKKRAK